MSVMKYVKNIIDDYEEGKIFDYNSFDLERSKFMALSKALSRLTKAGEIKRLKKGVYYKPRRTKYGELGPGENEILRNVLYKNKKRIGYITGGNLYNKLGLTTQIANEYQIAVNKVKKNIKIGKIKINYIKVNSPINEENYKYLQYLDVLKNIKNIPAANKNSVYKKIKKIILKLNDKQVDKMIELAKYYRASTNALLGTILENRENVDLYKLEKRLSPFSRYQFNISYIDNKKRWMIA